MDVAVNFEKNPTRSEKAFTTTFIAMLKEMDFKNIYVTEILLRSGFSRGAFYALFEDKYDLAKRIIDREMHYYIQFSYRYVEAMEAPFEHEHVLSIITDFMQHVLDNHELYECLLDSKFPGMTIDQYSNILMGRTKEYMSVTSSIEEDLSNQDLYDYIEFYGSILHIKFWRLNEYRFTPEEMAKKILGVIIRQTYRFHANKDA